jgi:predicted Zn-ribbon and HTH transcriptional regulator
MEIDETVHYYGTPCKCPNCQSKMQDDTQFESLNVYGQEFPAIEQIVLRCFSCGFTFQETMFSYMYQESSIGDLN